MKNTILLLCALAFMLPVSLLAADGLPMNGSLETKMGREPSLELPAIRNELERLQPGRIQEVDALSVAMEAGGAATMNVVMLGALLGFDDFPLSYDAMAQAIGTVGKPTYLQNNLLSLSKGAGR